MSIEAFTIPFSNEAVDDLRDRLARTRWPDEIPGSGWDYGVGLEYLQEVCRYWRESFDWKREVEKLASFHHYRYKGIHFIHERGKGPSPIPLVLTHGWPGSFLEMSKIIPMLTDPARYGGEERESFDVVVPSLPGYGFSDRPTERGMNTFRVAELWVKLMKELGYRRFAAQGGDFGAAVTTILGLRHADHVLGIHLNYIPGSYKPYLEPGTKLSETERAFLEDAESWYDERGGYAHLQRTEPQTLAYGLNDSPAALAAWILGKFHDWAGDFEASFTTDELLTNVTLYWMTETISSSCRLYYESKRAPLHFARGDRVRVPCAVARFPREAPFPPRPWIERGYDIHHWRDMPRGGHFAAAEEPELLASDLREFFGSVGSPQSLY
jgi:pimeloyl-ACP methyl ester carboxylesterase